MGSWSKRMRAQHRRHKRESVNFHHHTRRNGEVQHNRRWMVYVALAILVVILFYTNVI